jgi:hypothetical protein
MYARGDGPERLVVLLNFGREQASVDVQALRHASQPLHVWLSTLQDRGEQLADAVSLRPEEGVILGLGHRPS